ncbi:MAG: hypothetical protein CL916_10885 [Deltaproteobacteria bacterium]|nr:hypothetical protein [Deltaproteobacteria bacterium]
MILLLLACVFTPYRLERAVQKYDERSLIDHLQNGKYGYIRERAALGLHRVSPNVTIPQAQKVLRDCVTQKNEFDYVRGECAYTLAKWNDPKVAELIVQALPDVDDETRYWMANSLRSLDNTYAQAQLYALRNDSDPILAAAVRQWLGE